MLGRAITLFVACGLLFVRGGVCAQTTTWTGGGSTTNWSEAANWDNGVPAYGYDVVIDTVIASAMTMDISEELNSLMMVVRRPVGLSDFTFYLGSYFNVWNDWIFMDASIEEGSNLVVTSNSLVTVGGSIRMNDVTWVNNHVSLMVGGDFIFSGANSSIQGGISGDIGGDFIVDEADNVFLANTFLDVCGDFLISEFVNELTFEGSNLTMKGDHPSVISIPEARSPGEALYSLAVNKEPADVVVILDTSSPVPISILNITVSGGILDLKEDLIVENIHIDRNGAVQVVGCTPAIEIGQQAYVLGLFSICSGGSVLRMRPSSRIEVIENGGDTGRFEIIGTMDRPVLLRGYFGSQWTLSREGNSVADITHAAIKDCWAQAPLSVTDCIDLGNNTDVIFDQVAAVGDSPVSPTHGLAQNYPNPFSLSTQIRYRVPGDGSQVTVKIFDAKGALVRVLLDGQSGPSQGVITWDGRDNLGGQLATGVYFCQMRTPGSEETRRMVLLR